MLNGVLAHQQALLALATSVVQVLCTLICVNSNVNPQLKHSKCKRTWSYEERRCCMGSSPTSRPCWPWQQLHTSNMTQLKAHVVIRRGVMLHGVLTHQQALLALAAAGIT